MTVRAMVICLLLVGLVACKPVSDSSGPHYETDTATPDHKPTVPTLDSVGGRIRYQDRVYSDQGFITGNTPYKAARRVVVDLVNGAGDTVASTLSDDNGAYAFERVPAGDYQLRVLARAEADSGETATVLTLDRSVYAVSTAARFGPDSTEADIDISLASRMSGPFNMLDVMMSGVEFYHHFTGPGASLDDVDLYWQFGRSEGTYTCPNTCTLGAGIYVLSDPYHSGDTDEFDDDVLWHEFAHHIEFTIGLTDSPGGRHSLADTHLDLRLAWSEGFANYLQSAIKTWLRTTHPERLSTPGFLDTSHYTDNRSGHAISIDLADPPAAFRYASNETAVAKVLWELQQQAGQAAVWSPIVDQLPANAYADTLEAYWDGLLQSQPDNQRLAQWRSALIERAIRYDRDALEADHEFIDAGHRDCRYAQQAPAPCVVGERHSLYHFTGQADRDTLALAVSAGAEYRVWTHDLRNGADTRLGLYRADGSPVLDAQGAALLNDDAVDCETEPGGCSSLHDGTNFASSLTFTAAREETLYLVIDSADAAWTSPADYGYLARYGDYAVSVSLTAAPAP